MRVKTKCFLTGIAIVVLLALVALLAVFADKPTTASAATTPNYTVMLNGTYSQSMWGGGSTRDVTDAAVVTATTSLSNTHENISLTLAGSTSTSGTATLNNKDYINFSTVTFTGSQSKYTLTIYDEYSSSIATGKGSVTATLADGLYRVLMTYSFSSGAGYTQWHWGFSLYCYFTVDTKSPTMIGASTVTTGYYINNTFTVNASDNISGVRAIYMKSPDSSVYRSAGTTQVTINRGSTNGRYTFYAVDRAGNKSSYYYVNFDDINPTMSCSGATFGTNSNNSFTVTATDNSGSAKLYYKKDNNSWQTSGSSYVVSDTADDGIYYFYAEDSYGNSTSEMWVQVGAELYGEFIKSETDNAVYFTWERATWTATLDGESYERNTWITQEGEHTIKLSSNKQSAVFTYTIAHNYVEEFLGASCETAGYLLYECTQCGDSYKAYSLEEMGHYYVASTVAPTCTSGGYTVYTCTRCGDSYTDNYTHPLGHNYEATYQPATCTDYGKTVFTCQVCGSGYYETDGTYPTGHNYNNVIITAPTCTADGLRRSTCESCGHTFDTKISANGHNYSITETTTANGKTTRTYTCSDCGHSYKQELGDQYEEVTNYVEYLFEQYEPYMWWVLLASAGVWSIVIGVMIAIAHKNEDKEKARKMLINYVIGLVVIAVIVVACPFLVRGIAALVT